MNDPLVEVRRLPRATLRIGQWWVDPRADEIAIGDQVVKLEPLKMKLLMALAERPTEVVLTSELLDSVWSGLIVTSSSVYQGIAQLRRILAEGSAGPYIETIPRKGYRLVAPVERLEPLAEPVSHAAATRIAAVPAPPSANDAGLPALPKPSRRLWLGGAGLAAAAVAAGIGTWRWIPTAEAGARIAVMPFIDKSAGTSESALSQGLASDVIRALERYRQFDVVAAESMRLVADRADRLAEVTRRVSAGFVLLGDLTRVGSHVRIVVRLLGWPDEQTRWRADFDRTLSDLSLLPDLIASEAAKVLHAQPVEPSTLAGSDAYELFMLGQAAWRPKTPEAFANARTYFERGIVVDPAFARNYVGLGWTWLGQSRYGSGLEWQEAVSRALPLFEKALRLDPSDAEAITGQAVTRAESADHDGARELFARAIALRPGYSQAHFSCGVNEYEDGWPQRAMTHLNRAASLDPLNAGPHERLGLACVSSGRYADAELAYRRSIELEPAHPNGRWGMATLGFARGALDSAVSNLREALHLEPRRPFLWHQLGWHFLDLGLPDSAVESFRQTGAMLPKSRWPQLHMAFAWLIGGAQGDAPASIGLDRVPDNEYAVQVMLIRAMVGLELDDAQLQRALAAVTSRGNTIVPPLWFSFLGFNLQIDLGSIYKVMGDVGRADALLAAAEQQLDRFERQGNVWHMLHLHRARLLALRGDRAGALSRLQSNVAAGGRRWWLLKLDPAFTELRSDPAFIEVFNRMMAETERQRALV